MILQYWLPRCHSVDTEIQDLTELNTHVHDTVAAAINWAGIPAQFTSSTGNIVNKIHKIGKINKISTLSEESQYVSMFHLSLTKTHKNVKKWI